MKKTLFTLAATVVAIAAQAAVPKPEPSTFELDGLRYEVQGNTDLVTLLGPVDPNDTIAYIPDYILHPTSSYWRPVCVRNIAPYAFANTKLKYVVFEQLTDHPDFQRYKLYGGEGSFATPTLEAIHFDRESDLSCPVDAFLPESLEKVNLSFGDHLETDQVNNYVTKLPWNQFRGVMAVSGVADLNTTPEEPANIVNVYDLSGRSYASLDGLRPGIYIVKTTQGSYKIRK